MKNKEIFDYFKNLATKHKLVNSTVEEPKVFKYSILEIIEAHDAYEMDYCIVIESRSQKYGRNIDNEFKTATSAFYVLANYNSFEGDDKESIQDNCEQIANDFIVKMNQDSKCSEIFQGFDITRVRMNEVKEVVFPTSLGYRVEYSYTYQIDLNVDSDNWN